MKYTVRIECIVLKLEKNLLNLSGRTVLAPSEATLQVTENSPHPYVFCCDAPHIM